MVGVGDYQRLDFEVIVCNLADFARGMLSSSSSSSDAST
jgi:hypothetical protein